jgi:hypothetical protein
MAWHVFTKQFKNIVMVVVIVYVPINAIMFFLASELSFKNYVKLGSALDGLFGVVALMAITVITERFLRAPDEEIHLRSVLKFVCQRWPFLLWSNFTTSLILLGFALLLLVPGIIYGVYYSFLLPCVVLKNIYGAEARAYSKTLVTGQWWKVAFYLFVILGFGLAASLGLPLTTSSLASDIFSGVFIDTTSDVIWTFFEVAFVVFFLNLDATKVSQ